MFIDETDCVTQQVSNTLYVLWLKDLFFNQTAWRGSIFM